MKNKRMILVILIIIWTITIFVFSHQPSETSSNVSKETTSVILKWFPNLKEESNQQFISLVEQLNPIIRKLAHLSIYTVGGILLLAFTNTFTITTKTKVLSALLAGVIYAISDEFHQYFIPGRNCEIRDVIIDTVGIMIGIGIYWLIVNLANRKSKNSL